MTSYTHAGVSTQNGVCKVRFANDSLRVKVLAKNGHKDIDIVELKHPMSKEEAIAYLLKLDFDNGNKTVRAALEDAQTKRAPKAAKPDPAARPAKKTAPKPVPAKKVPAKKTATKKVAPTVEAIKARKPAVVTPEAAPVVATPVATEAVAEVPSGSLEDAPF